MRKVSMATRAELILAIKGRYASAGRPEKALWGRAGGANALDNPPLRYRAAWQVRIGATGLNVFGLF